MANYKKVLGWVGPIALPLVTAGIRHILKKKRSYENPPEGENSSVEDDNQEKDGGIKEDSVVEPLIDALIDVGLPKLTRTIRGSSGRTG